MKKSVKLIILLFILIALVGSLVFYNYKQKTGEYEEDDESTYADDDNSDDYEEPDDSDYYEKLDVSDDTDETADDEDTNISDTSEDDSEEVEE